MPDIHAITAAETLDQIQQNYFILACMSESGELSIGGLNVNMSGRQGSALLTQEKEKRELYDLVLSTVIENMRRELDALERRMAETFEILKGKYGEDVIGGMASTYLLDVDIDALKTDEQKLRALADKFLDADGEIKPEYKELDEALFVRDWREATELRASMENQFGKNGLSEIERDSLMHITENSAISSIRALIHMSPSEEISQRLNTHLDNRSIVEEEVVTSSSLTLN